MEANSLSRLGRLSPASPSCEAFYSAQTSMRLKRRISDSRLWMLLLFLAPPLLTGCFHRPQPSVTFDKVPVAGAGGVDNVALFEGDVHHARDGQRLVLYSKAGVWWHQPDADHAFINVLHGGHWKSEVHLGSDYAALLVDARFTPPATMPALPPLGNGIIAISTTPGSIEGPFHMTQPAHTIRFSGYDWLVRVLPTERLGRHSYSLNNVSVDKRGFLHLRIAKEGNGWSCSEVKLGRSLGYGTYMFTVEDSAHLEPAVVFSMFTWSDAGLSYNHREMNINLSRWGHAEGNNAEFVIQPFYVRTNSYRFKLPAGLHTFSFRWEPGSALFRSVSGGIDTESHQLIALHTFSGNIPPPSDEAASMNFCEFRLSEIPLRHEAEIVVERFQYLP